jgi:L-2,4-diaminobutyric acid acetyltransferase
MPEAEDGSAVHALVEACKPLDPNSAYCNVLQCTHFADTCVVAERAGELVGWISGYVPPAEPDSAFVWQVAVAPEARGEGLSRRLLHAFLARPAVSGVRYLKTTITADNAASWATFEGLARDLGVGIEGDPWLLRGTHLPAGHATEHLVTIGPLRPARRTS